MKGIKVWPALIFSAFDLSMDAEGILQKTKFF